MGCLTRVVVILIFGCLLVLAIDAVFAPWSFYMGGSFHWIPMWQGWGRMHTSSGDYLLFVRMQPRRGSRGVAHVVGDGVLCTPHGESLKLTMGADFERNMGTSTDGKHVYMWLHKRSGWFSISSDDRPSFELHGAWHNPEIVVDDHGTLGRNFRPDGTLNTGYLPAVKETVPLVLHEGRRSDFDSACQSVKSH